MRKNAIHLRGSRSDPTCFDIMPEDSEGPGPSRVGVKARSSRLILIANEKTR